MPRYNLPGFALLLLFALAISCTSKEEPADLAFTKLLCNQQENPMVIEHETPSFSWIVKASGFDRKQSAYRILVAATSEALEEERADRWDSGKVSSGSSTFVKYGGGSLVATERYHWKVKIWDEAGKASDWSEIQTFEMGLMNQENWGPSEWISLRKDTRTSPHRFRDYKTGKMETPVPVEGFAAAYFRKEKEINQEVTKARAYVCGLGYYELYLNGEKVGDHVLDPAPSNYDQQAYYVSYDITEDLRSGKNAFGLILGNGFYGQNISWKNDPESERDLAYGQPAVKLLVKLTYADGSVADFYTDGDWKEATGPIVFNNIYGGDTYDARFEIPGWNAVGYEDSEWGKAKVVSPNIERVSAQQIPAIKRLRELPPQRVFKGIDGEWIVDFGQNIAGWVKLTVQEKEGQRIDIITTEALLTNGQDIFRGSVGGGANGMPQIYRYICKGDGVESWEPKFSYHGFRYAKITGISRKPDANMISAVLVATDVEETGYFSSSEELLNQMHGISKWTIVDNLHGIPEDCPHREKCGWLGDAHAFCEYALYNYDMYDFYKKYMEDISTQMRPVKGHNDPDESFRAPTMIAPGKRTSTIARIDWGVATMYLPWYNYWYYGDDAIVRDYYEDMKMLTRYYLSFKGDDGIMQNGMGDWCPPLWDRRNNPGAMECDPIISANAYFYDVLGIMEKFAGMNGDEAFAGEMKAEKEALKKAFNAAFLVRVPETDHKWYQSQTATVQALQFGLVPEGEINGVVDGLVYDIVETKGGHHATGIHGNRYIYTVLAEYGRADLALQILTTPDFPSQTYVMNSGFTTWPERQFEWEKMKGPTNSLNHPMHSGFSAYFFESLGGIKSSKTKPGYKEFMIDPRIPRAISNTAVAVPSPYGNIKNAWVVDGNKVTMSIEVPFNTTAILPLGEDQKEALTVNGSPWQDFQPKTATEDELRLGSGNYEITYTEIEK